MTWRQRIARLVGRRRIQPERREPLVEVIAWGVHSPAEIDRARRPGHRDIPISTLYDGGWPD